MLEILNFFFIVFTGLGFSLIAVIHILYLPLKHKEIVINDPNILYLTEYVDKFETLDENNNTDISRLKHNILFERTPIGNIIMYYENDEFKYYCDRTPSFGFLETVARKYVIVFNCKRLYKIYSEQEIEEKKEKKEEDIKPKKKSVYANFKRYNNNKKIKINDNEPILQNKYKFIGKIRDFSFLQIEKKSEQKMSIQDFLKQIKNKS
tara:strand:- start:1833 stop:2453 length:621 start_codon:yes stop_codon:yes gene_type:complete